MGKIVGIDYGRARMGLAISDENGLLALPLGSLQVSHDIKKTVDALCVFLSKYSFSSVVVGLPLLMNGHDSPMTSEVRLFASLLETQLCKPIALWDERLTSKQVEKLLIEGAVKRKNRSKVIDTMSAILILQSYFDSKK